MAPFHGSLGFPRKGRDFYDKIHERKKAREADWMAEVEETLRSQQE
jgi:hypothetical protein